MTPPTPPTPSTQPLQPDVASSFTCPRCGRTSWHHHDVAERYCGACHAFTGDDRVIVPILGGYRVAQTDTHYLDVLGQLTNWRVAEVPKADPTFVERYWCYEGRDLIGLLAAAAAVLAWVASGDDEPTGWRKNGQTGAYGAAPAGLRHGRGLGRRADRTSAMTDNPLSGAADTAPPLVDRVETAARVLHDRRHRLGTAPSCGVCRADARAVAEVLAPEQTGSGR